MSRMMFYSGTDCRYHRRAAFRPLHAWPIGTLSNSPRLKPFKRGSGVNAALPCRRGCGAITPTAGLFTWISLTALVCLFLPALNAAASAPTRAPIVRALDLDVNETKGVELDNGTRARVKLLRVDETRDALRDAVRQARVQIELNGQSLVLTSATYHLPVTAAGVQFDCPITKG